MKLLFLHGSPAVGKLTVAKALLRIVPGRLMDNHAAIDLALTIFAFGAASRCFTNIAGRFRADNHAVTPASISPRPPPRAGAAGSVRPSRRMTRGRHARP